MFEASGKYAPYAVVFVVIVLNLILVDNSMPALIFFAVIGISFYLVRKHQNKPWMQKILKIF